MRWLIRFFGRTRRERVISGTVAAMIGLGLVVYEYQTSVPARASLLRASGHQIRSVAIRNMRYDDRVEFELVNGEIWTYPSYFPRYSAVAQLAGRDPSTVTLLASPHLGRDFAHGLRIRWLSDVSVGGKSIATYDETTSWQMRNRRGVIYFGLVFAGVGLVGLWTSRSAGAA